MCICRTFMCGAASTSAAEQHQAPLPAPVLQQWPGAALQPQHTCSVAHAEPLACSYSADGTFLVVGCRNGQVCWLVCNLPACDYDTAGLGVAVSLQ